MDKVIGVMLGVIVFTAVLLGGLISKADPEKVIRNALVMGWIACFVGWFLWGKLGITMAGFFEKPEPEQKPESTKTEEKRS